MVEARRSTGPQAAFWLLCAAFVGFSATLLEDLGHIIDEGVNILYGREIGLGRVPYRDFFYHQPPGQLFLLALVSKIDPHSVFLHRLPSLLATAASGGVLYAIGRRLGPPTAAVMAVALFYFNPLQTFDLLALPEAPMLFFSLLGVYAVFFRDGARWVAFGAVCLVVSVLFKPLSVATVAAVGIALLVDPRQRPKLLPFALVGTGAGLASFAVLHVASDGMFSEVLSVAFDRYTRKTWFARLQALTGLTTLVPEFFTRSPARFALFSHGLAMIYTSLALLPASIAGARIFLRRDAGLAPDLQPGVRALLVGWLAFPLVFSFVVWEPAWTHYHVQYLPALSLLGGLFLERLYRRRRALAIGWLATACALSALFETTMKKDYTPLRALELPAGPLLAFDPYLNVVTKTEPACGLDDPMNQTPPTVFERVEILKPYRVTTEMVIECMERSPEIPILLDAVQPHAFMVIDEEMYRYIQRQDEDRIVWANESDREALRELFEGS